MFIANSVHTFYGQCGAVLNYYLALTCLFIYFCRHTIFTRAIISRFIACCLCSCCWWFLFYFALHALCIFSCTHDYLPFLWCMCLIINASTIHVCFAWQTQNEIYTRQHYCELYQPRKIDSIFTFNWMPHFISTSMCFSMLFKVQPIFDDGVIWRISTILPPQPRSTSWIRDFRLWSGQTPNHKIQAMRS